MRACPSADVPHSVSPHPIPISESAALAAIDWFVELQSEHITPAIRQQWQAWRDAHPDHERAWQRIAAVQGTLNIAASPVNATIAHAALTVRGSARRKQAVRLLGVIFFAGTSCWVIQRQPAWRAWHADFDTAVGQQKTLYLEDGTELVLNTSTAVNLYFNDRERRIELIRGEILVTTAKDSHAVARPFLVDSREGRMQALGTVFSVQELDDNVRLAVFDGAVQVWPKRMSDQSLVVHAGEQLQFAATSLPAVVAADKAVIAWKDNMLIVKGMRLDDFLRELNRYSTATLVCDDSVAQLRISGSYPLHNIDTIVETLSAMLALRVEKIRRLWGTESVRFSLPERTTVQHALNG